MRPLAELRAANVRGLLFDLDDTLTTHGRLTAQAYGALEQLHAAGRIAVPVTGRPAGWCDHIARMWPVDAVVGENGAFYFWYDDSARKLRKEYLDGAAVRARRRAALDSLAKRILGEVPGCALASDQAYRETDLAIDYCEDVAALPLEAADRIAAIMREEGLCARISSIHVNGWFGDYDKLTTTRRLLAERWGVELPRDSAQFVFAGDSPNDAPMFALFEQSVGVANVARFAGRFTAEPRYVTRGAGGQGFAELVAHLLGFVPGEPPCRRQT